MSIARIMVERSDPRDFSLDLAMIMVQTILVCRNMYGILITKLITKIIR